MSKSALKDRWIYRENKNRKGKFTAALNCNFSYCPNCITQMLCFNNRNTTNSANDQLTTYTKEQRAMDACEIANFLASELFMHQVVLWSSIDLFRLETEIPKMILI